MELLRVVSMLMVLAVHIDGASLGLPRLGGNLGAMTARDAWQLVTEALAIVGVNCFTLISGYFGIRLRLRGVVSYLFECVFYAVGIYTAVTIAYPSLFSWRGWGESWMVLTHTDLWYVPAYFGLMLLSPVLNGGFDAMSRRMAGVVVGAFALYNVWAGWWWGGSFNPTGYTLVQLVLMYLVGRYVGVHVPRDLMRGRRGVMLFGGCYVLLSLLIALHACRNPGMAYAYNSPLVILSSVALLMMFSRMEFTSRTINLMARSAFAVYLVHKAPLIWGNLMRPAVRWMWAAMPLWLFTLSAIGLMAAIYGVCMCADWVRRRIFNALYRG